jgi:hypothetical protein
MSCKAGPVLFAAVFVFAAASVGRADDIRAKLEKNTDLDKGIEAPLNELLDQFGKKWQLKFEIDANAFAKEKLANPAGAKIKLGESRGLPLDWILRAALYQAKVVYEIRNGGIVIVPNVSDGKPRFFPPLLGQHIDIHRRIEAPLKDVLEFLSDRFGTHAEMDAAEFSGEKRKAPGDSLVVLEEMSDVSLDSAFRSLLKQVASVYEFRGNSMIIVPDQKQGKPRDYAPLPKE